MTGLLFWTQLDTLVSSSTLVIDRPKGTAHPRYPEFFYPYDYGYLAGTHSGDGEGIDVWLGSLAERKVTAVICTLDQTKRDMEIKILAGCTVKEIREIFLVHNAGDQSALLIERESE